MSGLPAVFRDFEQNNLEVRQVHVSADQYLCVEINAGRGMLLDRDDAFRLADALTAWATDNEPASYPPQSGGAADAVDPSVISRLVVEVEHLAERQAESDIAVLSLAGTVAELAARLVRALS